MTNAQLTYSDTVQILSAFNYDDPELEIKLQQFIGDLSKTKKNRIYQPWDLFWEGATVNMFLAIGLLMIYEKDKVSGIKADNTFLENRLALLLSATQEQVILICKICPKAEKYCKDLAKDTTRSFTTIQDELKMRLMDSEI